MNFNSAISWLLRSPLHRLVSDSFMLVEYTGRKSGKFYSVPVNYIRHERALLVLSYRDRVWWRNLRTEKPVLRLAGKPVPVKVSVMDTSEQAAEGLLEICRVSKGYQRFLKIGQDDKGQLKKEDALKAAAQRVVIRFLPLKDNVSP